MINFPEQRNQFAFKPFHESNIDCRNFELVQQFCIFIFSIRLMFLRLFRLVPSNSFHWNLHDQEAYQPFKRFVFKHIHYRNIDLILLSISCNYILLFCIFNFLKLFVVSQDLKLVDYKSFHWNLHKKIAHKPFKWFVLNRFHYRNIYSEKSRMFCNPNLRRCLCMERRSSPAFPPLLAFLTRAAPRVPHPNRRPLRRGRLCRPFELSRRVTLKSFGNC